MVAVYRDELAAAERRAENNDVWFAVKSDEFFRIPTHEVAERHVRHQPTYLYQFDWRSPAMDGWMAALNGEGGSTSANFRVTAPPEKLT